MAIYKKINNKDIKVAENSIIDHSQLTNRDGYNAHPISAIRNLPEKLTDLKNKSIKNADDINKEIEDRVAAIQAEEDARILADETETERAIAREDAIEDNAQRISLTDNNNGTLTFTNYDGETNNVRAGHLVDNTTIKEINDNSTLEVIGVKGTFVKNNVSITKTYDAEDIYDDIESAKGISLTAQVDASDNPTGKLLFKDYAGVTTEVQGGFLPDDDTIELKDNKLAIKQVYVDSDTLVGDGATSNTKLNAKAIKDVNGTITVSQINAMNQEIEAIEGRGGYLRPYDFQTTRPDLPVDDLTAQPPIYSLLTQYALQEIDNITDPVDIFNGTRVTNLYNNHTWILNNTPDTDPAIFEWIDLGQSLVSIATTDTLGVVLSSIDDYKVSVADSTGVMSVNGLPELAGVVGDTTLDTTAQTITGAVNELNTNKLDKVTSTTTYKQAYIKAIDGTQNMQNIADTAIANTLALRDNNGDVIVPTTPTSNNGATSKNYVDSGLNTKQPNITGAATTITATDLTANKAVISNNDGKIDVSNVTSTELSYLSGVTSAIQTQVDSKQETLISGTNIKTINTYSILGSGDLELSTFLPFPSNWASYTSGTTKAFCDVVNADTSAIIGKAYLGGVSFSDLPFNGNGDIVVEILQGPNNTKSIHLILTSGDVAPYR